MIKLLDKDSLEELSSLIKDNCLFWETATSASAPDCSGLDSSVEDLNAQVTVRENNNIGEIVFNDVVPVHKIRLSKNLCLFAIRSTIQTTLTNTTHTSKYYHCSVRVGNIISTNINDYLSIAGNLAIGSNQYSHTCYFAFGGGSTGNITLDTYGVVEENVTNAKIYLHYLILGAV